MKKQASLEELVSRVLDNDLTAEEFQTLESILTHSAEARAYYKEQSQLHALMGLELSGSNHTASASNTIIPMDEVLLRQRRKNLKRAAMAAAALVLLTLVTLQLFFLKPAPDSLAFRTAPGSQFILTHAAQENSPSGQILEPGSTLVLDHGTVELNFSSDVTAIVTAPAELRLIDYDHMLLKQGSAWFTVPPNAIGFKVTTPDLDIVDLGTEFGVHARPNGHDEVQVYTGKVQVTSVHDDYETSELTAGTACHLASDGRIRSTEFAPNAFLTNLPHSKPHLHWSFDDPSSLPTPQGDIAITQAVTSHTMLEPEQSFSSVSGRFGKALMSSGYGSLKTDWQGISGNAPRTIAYWVKVPPNKSTSQHIVGWGTQAQDANDAESSTRTFYSYLNKNERGVCTALSIGAHWLVGRSPINDDQWHHIAYVYTGKSNADGTPDIRCYLNGKYEQLDPFILDGVARNTDGDILVDTDTQSSNSQPIYLLGKMWYTHNPEEGAQISLDELYIFEASLTEKEVLSLYRHNAAMSH